LRISEECIVVDSRIATEISVEKFVKQLFSIAHSTAVYIAVEPIIIPMRIDGKLRSFAIGPGSAIICNSRSAEQLLTATYRVAEPCWGDAMMLIPYTLTTAPCSRVRQMGFEVDFDEAIGVPHICITGGNWDELRLIIGGGMAEVERYSREVVGALQISVKNTLFFTLAKGLLADLSYENIAARFLDIEFDYNSLAYLEDLAKIDGDAVIYGFGKGIITTFTDLDRATSTMYSLALLIAHLVDVSSAKAVVYKTRFT